MKEVIDFIRSVGIEVVTGEGNSYLYLPFWIKENEDGNHVVISPDKIPADLKDYLSGQRLSDQVVKNIEANYRDRINFGEALDNLVVSGKLNWALDKYPLTDEESYKANRSNEEAD